MKIDYHTPFYSNQFYHIYNRGNNGEKIFYTSENYLFFLSYSKAINQQIKRTGGLFQKRFKRTIIEDKTSLVRSTLYIHSNPAHHKLTSEFRNYLYSSYLPLLSSKVTKLKRDKVFEWFGGREGFISSHKQKVDEFKSEQFFLED